MFQLRIGLLVVLALSCTSVLAQDWPNEPIINHSTYQAVNDDGTSAYPYDGFPVRLRGVLLNNPEDWLDATFQNPPVGPGGQWEIIVQAVDLDGTAFDPDADSTFGDFGGTAAWMGQNYAFLSGKPDTFFYSTTEWADELARLNYAGGKPGDAPMIRAGDLIELRARGGKNFQGKMNVNEQHDISPDIDFEIVLLQQGFGRPQPAALTLDTFKDESDQYLFDPTRQTGGEHYQATWVELRNVEFVDAADWGAGIELELRDATGRTLPIQLGMNDSFDTMPAPDGLFNVSGIVNQGGSDTGGYYLVALDAGDFIVPEPATLMVLVGGGVLLALRRNAHRMR